MGGSRDHPGRKGVRHRGIGKALIREGLSRLKSSGAEGCALVGDPDYYQKFGFQNAPDLTYEGIPEEYTRNVLALSFNGKFPQGVIAHHPAFSATQ